MMRRERGRGEGERAGGEGEGRRERGEEVIMASQKKIEKYLILKRKIFVPLPLLTATSPLYLNVPPF